MLRYNINRGNVRSRLEHINVAQYLIDEYDDMRNILICNCTEDLKFGEEARIVVMDSSFYVESDSLITYDFSGSREYSLAGYDKENKTFSILYDRYQGLPIRQIVKTTVNEPSDDSPQSISETPLYQFILGESHRFSITPSSAYSFYVSVKTVDGWKMHEYVIGDVITNEDGTQTLPDLVDGFVLNAYTVAIPCDKLDNDFPAEGGFESYYMSDYSLHHIEDDDSHPDIRVPYQEFSRVGAYRDEPIFNEDGFGFELYAEKVLTTLKIPLSRYMGNDLMMDDAVRDKFVKAEREKCINPVIELEKDVFYPVKWKTKKYSDSTNYGELKADVTEIQFNLHFRRREDNEKWTTPADSMWNGVEDKEGEEGKFQIYDKFSSYSKPEEQADLLTYLGFANNDVKFQKNALKKSFLRLSFYDSPYPQSQSLLAYSTIYFNTGNAFAKYMANIEEEGYAFITLMDETDPPDPLPEGWEYSTDYKRKLNLVGISTNRERQNTENSEEKRLSCQFSVKGKYDSDASSDGFYLYLWKDNENGVIPMDIYLKVEFNHAGYGRTIPFMMPYKIGDEGIGIKTFNEVVEDWYIGTEGADKGVVYGYDMDKYQKYSYIHMKYKYDKEKNRHIYYLDDEEYGEYWGTNPDGVLKLNLYEAKVGAKEETTTREIKGEEAER